MKIKRILTALLVATLPIHSASASLTLGGGYLGQTGESTPQATIPDYAYEEADHYYYMAIGEHSSSPLSFSAFHSNTLDGYTRLQGRYTSRSGFFVSLGQSEIQFETGESSKGVIIGAGYELKTKAGATEIFTARDKALDEKHVLGVRQTIQLGSRLFIDAGYRRHKNHVDEFRVGALWRY